MGRRRSGDTDCTQGRKGRADNILRPVLRIGLRVSRVLQSSTSNLYRNPRDPQTATAVRAVRHVVSQCPYLVLMENVPGWLKSPAYKKVRSILMNAGYDVSEHKLDACKLGVA